MADDLVPLPNGQLPKLDRQTTKQLTALQRQTVMRQSVNHANEATAAAQIRARLAEADELGHEAVMYAQGLDSHITHATQGKQGLELSLRANIAEPIQAASGILIARYMMRPL